VDSAEMLTIPAVLGLIGVLALAIARRRALPAVLFGFALAWTGLVAYMTASEGFSGNQRYLMPAVSVVIVLAAAGAGHVTSRLGSRWTPAAAAALAIAFGITGALSLDRTAGALHYQADLVNALPGLIQRAGGAERLRACGHAYTGPFLVPAVAWHLGVHTFDVGLKPRSPAVVFRERTTKGRDPVPPMYEVRGHNLAIADNWRIVADSCTS
jgi:hypothetical protein